MRARSQTIIILCHDRRKLVRLFYLHFVRFLVRVFHEISLRHAVHQHELEKLCAGFVELAGKREF